MRKHHRSSTTAAGLLLALVLLISPAISLAAYQATPAADDAEAPAASPVIFYAADGMRPDLVETYAAAGLMPAFQKLIDTGVRGDNGLLQAFPPNTGAGWATLATGTWPGEHGSINNTFFRTGEADFASSSSFADPAILQADTLPQAAERAGKTVVAMEWVGSRGYDPPLQGPVVDYHSTFSDPGVLVNYDLPNQPAGAERFGVGYDRVDLRPAEGWTNAPASFSPAMEQQLVIPGADESNPDRVFDLYIYDSSDDEQISYDRVLIAPSAAQGDGATPVASPAADARDGAAAVADLALGDWGDIKVTLAGERAGQTAGFYLNVAELAPDLSGFRLYYTAIARANATYLGCDYAPDCAGPLGFEETLNAEFPSVTGPDYAPIEAGIINEETWAAQGLLWQASHDAYLTYIIDELGVQPDLLMLGNSLPDEYSHQMLGLISPTDLDGDPNPFFDDVNGDGEKDNLVDQREGYLSGAYAAADHTLALGQQLLGDDATTIAASDHGFAPAYYAVNAALVLQQAGLMDAGPAGNCWYELPADTGGATPAPDAPPAGPRAKACWAGGTANIYINLEEREPNGVVTEDEYEAVREQITAAFNAIEDPAHPGKRVVERVLTREELRDVDGSNGLHPSRSGDVVVVLRPPYQFDAAAPDQLIAPSLFFGQHGYLPGLVDLDADVNLHGSFFAAGPGVAAKTDPLPGVRAIDLASTAAFLMQIPGPRQSSGEILFDALANGGQLRQATILDVSDFHGQITPLTAAADTLDDEAAVNSSYPVGGAIALKAWFDQFRAHARDGAIVITAGDAIGASPPISSFFKDLPTIEIMNALGFNADGLGNHNFDVNYQNMFGLIAPVAHFPYLSANLVTSDGSAPVAVPAATPGAGTPVAGAGGFLPSATFVFGGVNVGLIGFTNPDLPSLTRPGALGPYMVADPAPAVNAEAARLRDKGVNTIVAFGHMGATGGELDAPSGPVVDLVDQLQGVDAVIADHTDYQVNATLANDVLLVENRSKGVMLTRVRLVMDTETGAVIYKTADNHRPWAVGIEPDPEIQRELDALDTQLEPILGTVIGEATAPILRSDLCGTENGRTCESLIGDLITDAMRTTYGVDFAITNSGGIRADLTCGPDGGNFCPDGGPANAISRGTTLAVLPFGNVAATLDVNGAQLKAMLEAGVAAMPAAGGGFPQVSGLCFTYDVTAAPGSRVTGAVRQATNGACTEEAVDFSEGATYTLVTNDFTAAGGDGYPDLAADATTRDVLDQVLANYISGEGTFGVPAAALDPQPQGRITCEGDGCPTPIAAP